MKDCNGIEICTGDFVRVSGGYFKSSNGVFLVDRADERSLWLDRVKKSGELCVKSATSCQSWPLTSYCSDARKNAAARVHNTESAKIEVVRDVPTWYASERFREKAKSARENAERERRNCYGAERAEQHEQEAAAYDEIAERLAANAEQPKAKESEIGIRFYWNGIKVDGGRLIPCWYSLYDSTVSICAKDYGSTLPGEYFSVKNDTDVYTDYFCKDSAELTPEHPLYKYARYAALKCICNGHSYKKLSDGQTAEFARMKDPGQPTAADLAAVEEMKLAAENARKAQEQAKIAAEREKALKARAEGRHMIETTAEQYPILPGAPVVTIRWSEHPAFYSWPENSLKLSVAAAEIVLKRLDEEQPEHSGYFKTSFLIEYADPQTGEPCTYEGRYDLGDHDGGMIEHIRSLGRWYRTHDERTGRELSDPPAELSAQEQIADHLEQYTAGGRVVKVDVAPCVIDLLEYRRKKEQEERERAEQEIGDIYAAVAMLTEEQLEEAVFHIDPNDKKQADVARFFLQELSRRDEAHALDVARRWLNSGK